MNKYSNKQKATAGVCVIALVHLLVCTISPPSDFENAFVLTNLIMGLCWVLELMVIFAPKSISDMIVDQSTQLWEWLKKECKELKIGSPKDSNPPFNRDVTANVVSEVLLEVSNRLLRELSFRGNCRYK